MSSKTMANAGNMRMVGRNGGFAVVFIFTRILQAVETCEIERGGQ